MFKITIEATTAKQKELLPLLLDHLCYSITDESAINLVAPDWKGHSGGDDAFFELRNKMVKVEVKQ